MVTGMGVVGRGSKGVCEWVWDCRWRSGVRLEMFLGLTACSFERGVVYLFEGADCGDARVPVIGGEDV
jgi:hypothetical protein